MPSRAKSPEDASMEDAAALAPTSGQKPATVSMSGENVDGQDEDGLDASGEGAEPEEEEPEPELQRVKILPGSSETAASFEFLEEGHTLGNALRYIIMKNPEVEFCAYSIPHPSEAKMNIRIQTYDTTTATAALEKGFQDLEDLCGVVSEKFWNARNEFNAEKDTAMQE
ncbi:DNA-directed RNA polymerase I and III polypeptide [Apiospora rasikravindrae]|uniref:DNA-directed RNA polymerase I and III polypeptide n=1 Tax=Apiospora rasikravindrae TaxID=990691 RepID=A0ABR1T5H0_9PEZI